MTLKKLINGARVLASSFPILAVFGKGHFGELFPPMGDDAVMWRCGASLILTILMLLPFRKLPLGAKDLTLIALCVLCLCATVTYLQVAPRYIVDIPLPNSKKKFVIRGSELNPTLDKDLRGKSDRELIEDYGQDDAGLEDVYTKESLYENRQELYWCYIASLGFLQLALGVAGKTELPETLGP